MPSPSPGNLQAFGDERPNPNVSSSGLSPTQITENFARASLALGRALRSWESITKISLDRLECRRSQLETLHDLRSAFSEISSMCEFLRHFPEDVSAGGEQAPAEYRQALEQFRSKLPRIQGWLCVERSRLAGRQAHSNTVGEWIKATRQTR